MHSKSFTIWKP